MAFARSFSVSAVKMGKFINSGRSWKGLGDGGRCKRWVLGSELIVLVRLGPRPLRQPVEVLQARCQGTLSSSTSSRLSTSSMAYKRRPLARTAWMLTFGH